MTVRRRRNRPVANGTLGHFVDTILEIGLAPVLVQQGFDTAVVHRVAVPVKRVPRYAHHPAGFRYVAQLVRQIQQSKFIIDDSLGTLVHKGYLCGFSVIARTTIKTGNPSLFKKCQIKSELVQLINAV